MHSDDSETVLLLKNWSFEIWVSQNGQRVWMWCHGVRHVGILFGRTCCLSL